MSKSINAQWSTDLNASTTGGTLTICTCWHITRVDGTEFFFTDHDQTISFSGDSYLTTTGFNRSALKMTGDLAAEGMSVVGIFDNAAIKKEDLIKGLFDGATVRIFLLNYKNIAIGALKMGYGRFGAITQATSNSFRVEFRDLTQFLNQEQGDLRQPECRANVGDAKCNNASLLLPGDERNPVPFEVPVRADSTAYVLGDVVKVSSGADPLKMLSPIVNPDFETGTTSGWNITQGGYQVLTSHGVMTPHRGTYMLRAGPSDPSDIEQKVDFRSLSDFSTANVDAGFVDIQFSIFRATRDMTIDDAGAVRIAAIDASLNDIGGWIYDTGDEVISPLDTWVERTSGATLPTNAVGVRVSLRGAFVSGDGDALFDNISLIVSDRNQAAGSSAQYEDRVYRCTTAGTSAAAPPTMNTTVGATTADGTVVWTAEVAYAVHGEVRNVTDQENFTVLYSLMTDATYDKPWFNLGAIVWETGDNTGWVSEVKIAEPPVFELKWPTPFTIVAGDQFRALPGCNRSLTICGDKFDDTPPTATARGNRDNFRAEPHLPGTAAFLQTPSAKV